MRPDPPPSWQQARRVLSVRLHALGGVLMCTPAMRALRDAVPGRSLTLLASPSGAAALPFMPEVDEAIVLAAPWMKGGLPARPAGLAALASDLFMMREAIDHHAIGQHETDQTESGSNVGPRQRRRNARLRPGRGKSRMNDVHSPATSETWLTMVRMRKRAKA